MINKYNIINMGAYEDVYSYIQVEIPDEQAEFLHNIFCELNANSYGKVDNVPYIYIKKISKPQYE